MDSACYDSTDNLIIGVRGSRVFKCDPTTGAITAQADYQTLGVGPASICWDSGINKCFATCASAWSFDPATGKAVRNIIRINPVTLATEVVIPATTFVATFLHAGYMVGPAVLKAVSGTIYGLWLNPAAYSANSVFRFQASNTAVHASGTIDSEYLSFAYANIGGDDRIVGNAMSDGTVQWWDFNTASFGQGPVDTVNRLSIEYVAAQNKFFCPLQTQFINTYDNTGTFVAQIDTGRTNFNGVNIKLNPNDGLLYIAGGGDNTVVVLNPATNTFVVKTGFDLPFDLVFTASKKWAVQQGATPLKEIV